MFVVLRLPHLVLAYISHYDRISVACFPPQVIDDVRRVEVTVVREILNVANGCVAFQPVDIIQPIAAVYRADVGQQLVQNLT